MISFLKTDEKAEQKVVSLEKCGAMKSVECGEWSVASQNIRRYNRADRFVYIVSFSLSYANSTHAIRNSPTK